MECAHVRFLLSLAGRECRELAQPERNLLEEHLEGCPECATLARTESIVDRALGRAMNAVPVPLTLRSKLLATFAQPRKPRFWPWISAAAAVLLAIGLGAYWFFQPVPTLNLETFVWDLDANAGAGPERVENYFQAEGLTVSAPRQFRYAFLESMNVQMVQGQKVGHMLFHFPGTAHQSSAVAHVYILPSRFLEAEQKVRARYPTSSHTIEFLPQIGEQRDFVYMVVFTGSSMEPFILRGHAHDG